MGMERGAVMGTGHDEVTEMEHGVAMVRVHDRAVEKAAYASGALGDALGRPIGDDDAPGTSGSAREARHSTSGRPATGACEAERGKVLGTFRDEALVK